MAERSTVEEFLHQAYAARQREDLDEIMALFHPAACFGVVGGDQSPADVTQCRSMLAGILDTFQLLDHSIHSIVIEGERAAVHWRGRFRARATGRIGETDMVDVIELRDGRIARMKSFFDTALAAELTRPAETAIAAMSGD